MMQLLQEKETRLCSRKYANNDFTSKDIGHSCSALRCRQKEKLTDVLLRKVFRNTDQSDDRDDDVQSTHQKHTQKTKFLVFP